MNHSNFSSQSPAKIAEMVRQESRDWFKRIEWPWSLWIVVILVILSTLVFWISDLDIRVMQLFFEPANPQNSWPLGKTQPWRLLYKSGGILTLVPTISALGILIASRWYQRLVSWRRAALFIVLCFALGPGLTVNAIFKDHWKRPRPRHIVEFGGQLSYIPPLAIGESKKGKSFPSGHCSIAFAYGAFFFLFRKKRPRIAAAVLAGSLVLGALMGVARMAAGGHFPSDVLWAAYLTLGVAYLLSPILIPPSRPEGFS